MIIFSFSFHRDCASKVMRKDWQAQEAFCIQLHEEHLKNEDGPRNEFEKCFAKVKKAKGPAFPFLPEALRALNQRSNLILNFTDCLV